MIIGWLQSRENRLRAIAKDKGIKIRQDKQGIKLYYPNGDKYLIHSWSHIEEYLDTGQVILYDETIYKPLKL